MKACGRIILIASLALLIGCFVDKKIPRIQFLPAQSEEDLLWAAGWGANKYGVRFYAEIYALDKDIVFLLGNLSGSGASVRSLLLRSEDGGKHWKEVMTPLHGSDVIEVLFVNKHTGWALVAWTTEGPGELFLYGTEDSGRSWQKLSDIPKRHYSGQPIRIEFFDEKNGQIEMLYDCASPPTDGFVVLNTSDGGITWREIRSLSLDEYKKEYRNVQEIEEQTTDYVSGKDGSRWKTQKLDREIRVLRRLQAEDAWRVMCVIPRHFGYSKGQVITLSKVN